VNPPRAGWAACDGSEIIIVEISGRMAIGQIPVFDPAECGAGIAKIPARERPIERSMRAPGFGWDPHGDG
jgi:hypothetical protein